MDIGSRRRKGAALIHRILARRGAVCQGKAADLVGHRPIVPTAGANFLNLSWVPVPPLFPIPPAPFEVDP